MTTAAESINSRASEGSLIRLSLEAGLLANATLNIAIRSALDDAILNICAVEITDVAMVAFARRAIGKDNFWLGFR